MNAKHVMPETISDYWSTKDDFFFKDRFLARQYHSLRTDWVAEETDYNRDVMKKLEVLHQDTPRPSADKTFHQKFASQLKSKCIEWEQRITHKLGRLDTIDEGESTLRDFAAS
jgi:hypothetical protein